jgi:hypothetical protein
MGILYFNLDSSAWESLLDLPERAQAIVQKAGNALAAQTHAHITDLAQQRLHTRRKMYVENLTHFQVDEHTWVVNLDASVRWIEEGMDSKNLLDDLLASPKAKRAKDGSKFLVVPFQHNKGKQLRTPAQQSLTDTIQKELKAVGTSLNQIETDRDGNPKLGLIRSLDINTRPISTSRLPIGTGPKGQVAQGKTGIPILRGVQIYQKKVKGADGSDSIQRSVMTFRVASSKQMGKGQWQHPGLRPMNFFESAESWALQKWDQEIAPWIMEQLAR